MTALIESANTWWRHPDPWACVVLGRHAHPLHGTVRQGWVVPVPASTAMVHVQCPGPEPCHRTRLSPPVSRGPVFTLPLTKAVCGRWPCLAMVNWVPEPVQAQVRLAVTVAVDEATAQVVDVDTLAPYVQPGAAAPQPDSPAWCLLAAVVSDCWGQPSVLRPVLVDDSVPGLYTALARLRALDQGRCVVTLPPTDPSHVRVPGTDTVLVMPGATPAVVPMETPRPCRHHVVVSPSSSVASSSCWPVRCGALTPLLQALQPRGLARTLVVVPRPALQSRAAKLRRLSHHGVTVAVVACVPDLTSPQKWGALHAADVLVVSDSVLVDPKYTRRAGRYVQALAMGVDAAQAAHDFAQTRYRDLGAALFPVHDTMAALATSRFQALVADASSCPPPILSLMQFRHGITMHCAGLAASGWQVESHWQVCHDAAPVPLLGKSLTMLPESDADAASSAPPPRMAPPPPWEAVSRRSLGQWLQAFLPADVPYPLPDPPPPHFLDAAVQEQGLEIVRADAFADRLRAVNDGMRARLRHQAATMAATGTRSVVMETNQPWWFLVSFGDSINGPGGGGGVGTVELDDGDGDGDGDDVLSATMFIFEVHGAEPGLTPTVLNSDSVARLSNAVTWDAAGLQRMLQDMDRDAEALGRRVLESQAAVQGGAAECSICRCAPCDAAGPCGHVFCTLCLMRWRQTARSCPACKQLAAVVVATSVRAVPAPTPLLWVRDCLAASPGVSSVVACSTMAVARAMAQALVKMGVPATDLSGPYRVRDAAVQCWDQGRVHLCVDFREVGMGLRLPAGHPLVLPEEGMQPWAPVLSHALGCSRVWVQDTACGYTGP